MPSNGFLTTAQVAKQLDVSTRTTARLVAAGELKPATKLPGLRGAFLFSQNDVTRYIAKRAAA